MKMLNITILFVVMYLAIGVLDHTFDNTLHSQNQTTNGFLLDTIFQPENWGTNNLLTLLGAGIIVGIAAVALTAGTISVLGVSVTRSDISAISPLAIAFIAIGAVPIVSFYGFVTRNVGQFACTVGQPCGPAQIFGALTAGILAIIWIYSVMTWWLWRDMG